MSIERSVFQALIGTGIVLIQLGWKYEWVPGRSLLRRDSRAISEEVWPRSHGRLVQWYSSLTNLLLEITVEAEWPRPPWGQQRHLCWQRGIPQHSEGWQVGGSPVQSSPVIFDFIEAGFDIFNFQGTSGNISFQQLVKIRIPLNNNNTHPGRWCYTWWQVAPSWLAQCSVSVPQCCLPPSLLPAV